jgi:hypothetical protein
MKDIYNENYETLKKKIEEDTQHGGTMSHVHILAE